MIKYLKSLFSKKDKKESNFLKIGDKFIGKLNNEYNGKIIIINERMLLDDEHTLFFLHYNGFEEMK